MACWPKIVSYPGIVPSSFLKEFCLLPDCPLYISSVQSLSHVQLFAISWGAAWQVSLSITNSQRLFKLMLIKLMMLPNNFVFRLHLCLLPLIFPSIGVFYNESVLPINWPKYWRFSLSIGPSNEYSGLISFRMGWLDLHCSPRDSQESCPTPQFKSINSLVLNVLYGPTLTSTHDYWKSRSFD